MKCINIIIALFLPYFLISQSLLKKQNSTYAVVVGISDYLDPNIPDLLYAHKDAEAFANFLRSPVGGALNDDQLKILINEDATNGKLVAAFDWLIEQAQEGDQSIIYFSGHGDIETKTRRGLGFLLPYDSPSRSYMAGAFPIYFLQNIIETISLDKKAKMLLITDACRSGKLAGNAIGGAQLTSLNLVSQFANEVKILSCQPDEYSIEGKQWGGGRGAFSYHLLDGLYGMADENADLSINLKEIGRYLEDHVAEEVAPQNQNPMTVGNKTENLTYIYPEILNELKKGKQAQMVQFKSTESKGIEDGVLAATDTAIVEIYMAFKKSLKNKNFLEPIDACADAYYEQLIREPQLKGLYSTMRRNYAAALQDDAQQVLNNWLNSGNIDNITKVKQSLTYKDYPGYLGRAIELLGVDHYMYSILQARKLYFEGYLMHIDHRHADKALGEKILKKYREALVWQPESPHIFYSMMEVNFYQMLRPDSAEYYAHRATEVAPSWILPYSKMGFLYSLSGILTNHEKARHFLELGDQIDSVALDSNIFHMSTWANYFSESMQLIDGEQQYNKIIDLDTTLFSAYSGLATIYWKSGDWDEAEVMYKKAISLDSTDHITITRLGLIYSWSGRPKEAEVYFKKAIKLDTTYLWPLVGMAQVYVATGRYVEADAQFEKLRAMDSMALRIYTNIAQIYIEVGKYERAAELCLMAIKLDPNYLEAIRFLGHCYVRTNRYEEAEQLYLKVLSLDSLYATQRGVHANLGVVYTQTNRYREADHMFQQGLKLRIGYEKIVFVGYALLYSLQGETEKAFEFLEKGVGCKLVEAYVDLKKDPGLAPMREQKVRWEGLMKLYFPEDEEK